ncbi:hypothetical protein MZM67_002562 [Enterococcus faecium]|nr:hypothetical protein [Enterococcus faecium]
MLTGFLVKISELFVLGDLGSTLQGISDEAASNFQNWGNTVLGILILIYGAASFLGVEIRATAKKWVIGGFVGAVVLVNYRFLLDLFWSAIGG